MSNELVRIKYTGSALPGNGETIVLVATAPTSGSNTGVLGPPGGMGNFLQMAEIRRIALSLTNDQTGTLNLYQSQNRGSTWVKVYTTAVAASAANSENQYDIWVEPYPDIKLEWVNGATPQTTFTPNIVGVGQRVVTT